MDTRRSSAQRGGPWPRPWRHSLAGRALRSPHSHEIRCSSLVDARTLAEACPAARSAGRAHPLDPSRDRREPARASRGQPGQPCHPTGRAHKPRWPTATRCALVYAWPSEARQIRIFLFEPPALCGLAVYQGPRISALGPGGSEGTRAQCAALPRRGLAGHAPRGLAEGRCVHKLRDH